MSIRLTSFTSSNINTAYEAPGFKHDSSEETTENYALYLMDPLNCEEVEIQFTDYEAIDQFEENVLKALFDIRHHIANERVAQRAKNAA